MMIIVCLFYMHGKYRTHTCTTHSQTHNRNKNSQSFIYRSFRKKVNIAEICPGIRTLKFGFKLKAQHKSKREGLRWVKIKIEGVAFRQGADSQQSVIMNTHNNTIIKHTYIHSISHSFLFENTEEDFFKSEIILK